MLPFWQAGVQIHSHANGDATVEMTLDVLDRLLQTTPRFDHRFVIEHYCLSALRPKRGGWPRSAGRASVNAYFVQYRAQMHADAASALTVQRRRLGSARSSGPEPPLRCTPISTWW